MLHYGLGHFLSHLRGVEEARGRFSHSLLFGDIDLLSALCNDPIVVPTERCPCLSLLELF